ncbi:hypothetical protein JW933_08430 [candidate division FCPU426 bacterium]|nr:hypothetical protein [candidate division FCPU426 bacterium]
MKKTLLKIFVPVLASMSILSVSAPEIPAAPVGLDIPVVSKYVWRGIEANEDPVLQPSLTVDFGSGFTFNVWGNMDLTGYGGKAGYGNRSGEFTELDLTGEYSRSFGSIGISAGMISYIFPGLGATTHELYGKVTAELLASPALAFYSDIDEIKGSYFLLGVSHTFALAAGVLTGVDLGVNLGYGSGSYNRGYFGVDKAAPVDLVASVGFPMSLSGFSITPAAQYSAVLDSEIQTALDKKGYFAASLTLGLSF